MIFYAKCFIESQAFLFYSLSANEWLQLAGNLLHQKKDGGKNDLEAVESSLDNAEALPLCFPPLNLGGASAVLDPLRTSSGGERFLNTLAFD